MAITIETLVIIFAVSFVVNVLFILLLVFKRKEIIVWLMEFIYRKAGVNVLVYKKDRTVKKYLTMDVRKLDWKKKFLGKLLENLPDWINQNNVPDTPYARDADTWRGQYTFFEDSKKCIDPYENTPNLYLREMDANDAMNYFESGVRFERMKAASYFNKLLLALLVFNLLLGIGSIYTTTQMQDKITASFTALGESIGKLNDSIAKITPKAPAAGGGGVVGQVG